MASFSIPNSNPANGRISKLSLARSRRRKPDDLSEKQERRKRIQKASGDDPRRAASSARSNFLFFNSCFPAFLRNSSFRRVKGAWWSSRSSKSSSVPNDRGRFDSYPLRLFERMNQEKRDAGKEFAASGVSLFFLLSCFPDSFPFCVKGGDGMSREQIRKLTSLSSCAG